MHFSQRERSLFMRKVADFLTSVRSTFAGSVVQLVSDHWHEEEFVPFC